MNALFVQALQLQLNSCVFNTFISHPATAAGDVTKCQQPAHKRNWTHFPFHRTMPFGLNFRRHVSVSDFFASHFYIFFSFCWLCRARALAQRPKAFSCCYPERAHTNIESLISEWSKKKTTTTRHGKMCSEQLIASGRKKSNKHFIVTHKMTHCVLCFI